MFYVKYVFRPWMRSLQEAAMGKWNGAVGWLNTDDHLKQFYFSEPIMRPTPIFFQRKDNPIKWETMSDLQGVKVGTTTGYYYGEEFNRGLNMLATRGKINLYREESRKGLYNQKKE